MSQKYIHYFGNESSESLLEAYGIVIKDKMDTLNPKICPSCDTGNTQDAKFCQKCSMIMSFEGYQEALESQKEKESEVQRLQQKYEQDMKTMQEALRQEMRNQISQLITKLKPEIITEGLT